METRLEDKHLPARNSVMIRRIALAAVLMVCSAHASAQSPSADPIFGRKLAAHCASCHGTNGRSIGGMPSLAGRRSDDLVRQLKNFRDGKQPSTIMPQLAKAYSNREIEAIAAFFAAQKPQVAQ
jgi:sulfide dehydrogenase cytochrome subunit